VGLSYEICVEIPTRADDEDEDGDEDEAELLPLCTELTYAVGFPDV
jgi:hypothetical protein